MQRREFLAACSCATLSLACRPRRAVLSAPKHPTDPADPASSPAPAPAEQILEQGESEFNHVIVTQQGSLRKMYFETDGDWKLQSTYDLAAPDALHHEVFQTMVAGLLLQPAPRRMCMVGLGGGQLSNYLFRNVPELELDVVDICPEVVRLARKYFGVPDDPRYRVTVDDGRVFVDRLEPGSLDLLFLDAYRGHSIPKHLRSQEFHTLCAARLNATGAVVANMHRRTPRYPIDRATMGAVYRHVYRFASADDVQTSIVANMAEAAATPMQLHETARLLQPRFDFDLISLAQRCRTDESGWAPEMVVHDDFESQQLDEAARAHNLSCAPRCEGDR
jgi:spermidine synthase